MKTAIIYYSKHHGNTKKLVDAINEKHSATLIDASQTEECNLEEFDLIGFASGIYYSKFHKTVTECAKNNLPNGKKVFLLYTCGAKKESYTKALKAIAEAKGGSVIGEYGALGYDTFGPFKLIGGMAKGHPDSEEISKAVEFYENLIK